MRTLILGGGGMLGHKLYQTLSMFGQTYVTVRRPVDSYAAYGLFAPSSVIDHVDVLQPDDLHRAFAIARPDAVINCVGIIKQLDTAKDPIACIHVNALLPHRIASLSDACGARFIHISTDCVFSGACGPYSEDSQADATDLYGRSKLLGETTAPNAVTLRTSIIGRELNTTTGLVEWFLSQSGGSARGYANALFSGLPTLHLSRVIRDILCERPKLQGLWQVSSDPISKYELLDLINAEFGLGITLIKDEDFHCDRRLDSARFRRETGFVPDVWPAMIEELRRDAEPYDRWRSH